jgi:Coenzyme PQQ synthesis protein D (PqqD)
MSTNTQLETLAISETGFVFDPRTGATFTLNPVGLAVVVALRDGLSVEDAIARLHERFEHVPVASARDEVVEFIHLLRQHGLLPASFQV